jgi:membrane protease YdiL (CAAX protease family)
MEEVLFRGYLLQGFSAWFKSIPAAIILSGVVFGLLHGMNPEVASLGWGVMVFYIGTGVFLSALTVMDDGLELVIGFHAANNIAAVLLVTSSWTVLKTDALFMDTSEPALGWSTFITMTLLYPLLLFFFFKKYKWGSFKSLLGINFKK